jgi:SNF2 family DNA or RNA helicase
MTGTVQKAWQLQGDQLLLVDGSDTIYPTADDVYRSVIEKRQVFADILPGPPSGLESVTFSRYPAELKLSLLYKPNGDGTGLYCRVLATKGSQSAVVDDFPSRKCDHIIIDKTWYPFLPGDIQELNAVLADARVDHPGEISFRQYLQLKRLATETPIILDNTADSVIHPGIETALPEHALDLFTGTLYPYQEDGFRWLNFVCQQGLGGILADEMGLGKTIQIIAVLASPDRERVAPSLIVAPSTLLENWRREVHRFAPTLHTCIHQGPERTGLPETLRENDVVIASYDTVARDSALFDMVRWKLVVLDEAQAIKNPDTRRARRVKQLKREVSIAVTGTPVENRLRDLWSILDFAISGYLGTESQFEAMFGDDEQGGRAVEPFVSPVLLRRRVAEVAKDLPERIDVPQVIMLDDIEIARYERERQAIVNAYGNSATLVALIKLRMFCAHPWLLEDSAMTGEDPATYGKYMRLVEILEEIFANGEKAIVFTSYNRMSDIIVADMRTRFGVFSDFIDGRVPVPERQGRVDTFAAHDGPAVLVLNPRAAGTGLNITAANHVIHYNLEWNPSVEDQASARAYRRGQEKPVTVQRLIVANTVEEAIDERLARKRGLAEAAVVGVSGKEDELEDIVRALQYSPAGRKSDASR